MLIITGPGRCGSSLMAGFCKNLGFDPGGNWIETIKGGYEDCGTMAVNQAIGDDLFRNANTATLTATVHGIRRDVVKDPRFIWYGSSILDFWCKARSDIRVLFLTRDLASVWRSMRKQTGAYAWTYPDMPQQLHHNVRATLFYMAQHDVPFRVLRFPDFLDQYDRVAEALHFGGLQFNDWFGKTIWERLVDRSLVTC